MEEDLIPDHKTEIIRGAIEQKLGKVFNEDTGEIEQRKFDDISLANRCGDVSRVTNSVINGEIKTYTANGINPSVVYCEGESEVEIASAFRTANHAYVVDKEGKVWDPITRVWGSVNEKEFLSRLHTIDNS